MIYDLMLGQEALLNDPTEGFNAEIQALNTAKGTTAPDVAYINIWEYQLASEIRAWPILQVYWGGMPSSTIVSQQKRRSEWSIEWQYWTGYLAGPERWPLIQQDLAITVQAMMRMLDKVDSTIPGWDTTQNINAVNTGWREGERTYVVMGVVFTAFERDENP